MIRTQIYLTKEEKAALSNLAAASGKNQSELIREAVDNLITNSSKGRRLAVLDRVAGIWKDRNDLPEFTQLRKEWDRDPLS
ncbi:hypothetical protein LCGC14_2572280 [marine sediment metagenome]|uniref:Ribbon-helix-helix protein CopG domain-containing protein n=1 Tax=marine sediment metagenome TaxID=412755 RepID=A0A0F9CT31_9ZZZZ